MHANPLIYSALVDIGDRTEQAAAEAIVDLASQPAPEESVAELITEGEVVKQIQLSANQIQSLSSGDLIEINGDTYKVRSSGSFRSLPLCHKFRNRTYLVNLWWLGSFCLFTKHPIKRWTGQCEHQVQISICKFRDRYTEPRSLSAVLSHS